MAWYWIVLIVLGAIALWFFLSAVILKFRVYGIDDEYEALALGSILPAAIIVALIILGGRTVLYLSKKL